jgi:hypothetical protein
MDRRKNKILDLRKALRSCIVLSEDDKRFWLDKVDELPDVQLDIVLNAIRGTNEQVDLYLDAALEKDGLDFYLKDLKNKIKKIKLKAFRLEEESEKENLDENLLKQIQNNS